MGGRWLVLLWLACFGPPMVRPGVHRHWKQQEQQRLAHTDLWTPADDSNATCVPSPRRSLTHPRVVAIGAPFYPNGTDAALLVPVVASVWHHHGWQPLVVTAGAGWQTAAGRRILAELRCLPGARRRHAAAPEAGAAALQAGLLEELPPDAVLVLRRLDRLPLRFPIPDSAQANGSAPETSAAAGMPVRQWLRVPAPAGAGDPGTSPLDALLADLWPQRVRRGSVPRVTPARPLAQLGDPTLSGDVDLSHFQAAQWPALQQLLRQRRLLPLPGVQRLQRLLFEVAAPACRPAQPRLAEARRPRFFYFGITYPDTHFLLEVCHETWVQAIPGMVWYSVAPHPLVTHVLPDHVRIIQRIGIIWEHISLHYGGYDWYVRCWEDNYVFPHRVEQVALRFRPSEPLIIGHTGWLKHHRFVLGGPPGLWSGATLRLMVAKYGTNFSRCLPFCRADPFITSRMEDVCWSLCARKVGVRLISHCGFPFESPFLFHVGLSETDVSCGFPTTDDRHSSKLPCSTDPAYLGPVAFHYVKAPAVMRRIHALAHRPCPRC